MEWLYSAYCVEEMLYYVYRLFWTWSCGVMCQITAAYTAIWIKLSSMYSLIVLFTGDINVETQIRVIYNNSAPTIWSSSSRVSLFCDLAGFQNTTVFNTSRPDILLVRWDSAVIDRRLFKDSQEARHHKNEWHKSWKKNSRLTVSDVP